MRRDPYRAAFVAMTVALLVACSPGGKTPAAEAAATGASAEATLKAAMDADTAFAAMAKSEGLKPAFLKYMHATDSKFLQPGVVVTGAAAIAAGFDQTPPDFKIDWTPDGGHGAASGDLAVTTGLFTISAGGQLIEKGRYVTVWSKDEAGELKAVMDLSVPDPAAMPITTPDPDGRPG
jgi:ketosteroid isomerase-like protein